jgi:transcriptional regulator with AAA-type ATPase domain
LSGRGRRAQKDEPPTVKGKARARAAGGLCLIVADGSTAATYPLVAEGRLLIGRSCACDVVVANPLASREHAVLRIGDAVTIEDLDSANGTLVGGKPVAARVPVSLRAGEVVAIGSARLVLAGSPRAAIVAPADAGAAGVQLVLGHGEVVVRDPAMRALYTLVDRIAPSDISVLVLGETGVGKDVIASAIHQRSRRRAKPFVRINCAALSESLLESELFGYEAGAFTGARGPKPGLLETAHEGTVFLDEVGELPPAVQAKLLRVLESREVTRLGGLVPRRIDVRFVSATNRALDKEVERGGFRRDLFFRLDGASVWVPPLRQRPDEVELLADLFARAAAAQLGRSAAPAFTAEARAALRAHPWPGNAREIRNVIQRAVLLCQNDEIRLQDLSFAGGETERADGAGPQVGPAATAATERERIVAALLACAGNQSRAAEMLAIPRRTLVKRLVAYNIPRPQKRKAPGAGGVDVQPPSH